MKASDIIEGTATSKNTNDRWSAANVDVFSYAGKNEIRVRNFMNNSFSVPTKWKEEASKNFKEAIRELDISESMLNNIERHMWSFMSEAVTDEEEFIEEQIMEILDVAERLSKSLLIQYTEKQRYILEEMMKNILHDPENAENILKDLRFKSND